jgi:hypothetical protein
MVQQLGDFLSGSIVRFMWNTNDAAGASINPSVNGTIRIYKDDSTVERSSSSGITDTIQFDGLTGVHHTKIDLSDNTDPGYYSPGSDFFVVRQGMTVDGKTVNACLAHFSIEKKSENRLKGTFVVGSGATTTSIPTSTLTPAAAATDQFKGRVIVFSRSTPTAALRGQADVILSSTAAGVLTVNGLTTAPASGDFGEIL